MDSSRFCLCPLRHPYITVINLSQEYNHVLSPMSSSREYSNVDVLRDLSS